MQLSNNRLPILDIISGNMKIIDINLRNITCLKHRFKFSACVCLCSSYNEEILVEILRVSGSWYNFVVAIRYSQDLAMRNICATFSSVY